MVNIRLRDYDTGAEVAVMTRRVRGKMNKEKEFMQELEQAAFQSKYEIACRLVVDRIEKINKEISEEKERKYIKDMWKTYFAAHGLTMTEGLIQAVNYMKEQEEKGGLSGAGRAAVHSLRCIRPHGAVCQLSSEGGGL